MSVAPEKKLFPLLAVLMIGISFLIYWRVFSLPFVSDDWWYVRLFQVSGTSESLRYFFDPIGKMVYRPLAEACMLLMYKFFGFNPDPMRILGIFVHVVNSCLVVLIVDHVTESKLIGYVSGIVFASAVAIHLDLFAWAWAAYYDIGGSLFFFLAIWLYLRDRPWLSAVSYFSGCLFKEAVVLLPILLVLHSMLLGRGEDLEWRPFHWLRKWILFVIFGGVVLGFKLISGGNPTALGEDHPYAIVFWGEHLVTNGGRYLTWLFQAIFPFFSPSEMVHKIVAYLVFIIFLVGTFTALLAVKQKDVFRRIIFLIVWLVIGILPVYLLPNHSYRYYAVYSLPAFAALLFYSLQYLLIILKADLRVSIAVFTILGCFAVIGSFIQSTRIFNEKLHQSTFSDGSSMLIRRAATVSLVMPRLEKDFPSIPPGFVIVLVNADLGAFGFDNRAIQYLYNFDAFEVLPPSAISYENGDWFFTTPESAPQYLDPSLVVVYELIENDIVRRDLDDLVQPENVP